MSDGDKISAALAIGHKKADEILARRKIARAKRVGALEAHSASLELQMRFTTAEGMTATASFQTAGFLVAAGDSWFDYPFCDVLKVLEDSYGYNVESAAHSGAPIEAMAYYGGQLEQFARCLEKVLALGATPKAVLLSGGGDDIAGNEFGMLLNNATSSIAGWNAEIIDGLLNQRIVTAYTSMLGSINGLCERYLQKKIPIFVHGYDYPVPDGRGFWGGWPFPGPWLEPGFQEKLFTDLRKNIALLHDLIDRFNAMLAALAKEPGLANVLYVDLRGTLSTKLENDDYKQWWDNELHPTERGFDAVTARFAAELGKL